MRRGHRFGEGLPTTGTGITSTRTALIQVSPSIMPADKASSTATIFPIVDRHQHHDDNRSLLDGPVKPRILCLFPKSVTSIFEVCSFIVMREAAATFSNSQ